MKPESLTNQVLSIASEAVATRRCKAGVLYRSPIELSEAAATSLLVVAAILDTLDVEQRQRVLDKLKSL